MPTITYTIAASHDDSFYDTRELGGQCNNEAVFIKIGAFEEAGTFYAWYGAVRFDNITQGNGHKILSAYLRVKAADDGLTSTIRIRGVLQLDPATWQDPNCNPDVRPSTTAYIDWSTGARTQGEWYNSDDISAVVQELLEQEGWTTGNAIALMLSGQGGASPCSFSSYDLGDHSSAPQLVVTWQPKAQGYML